MSFWTLDRHNAIGWDVDGTLVNNPSASRLHNYIRANPQKRHCLVTFRTYDLLDTLEYDLARAGIRDISIFDKVLSVPVNTWMQWAIVQQNRKSGKTKGKLLGVEIEFMEWKGFICRTEGLTVLVDDDADNVERGCKRFGVEFVNTASL